MKSEEGDVDGWQRPPLAHPLGGLRQLGASCWGGSAGRRAFLLVQSCFLISPQRLINQQSWATSPWLRHKPRQLNRESTCSAILRLSRQRGRSSFGNRPPGVSSDDFSSTAELPIHISSQASKITSHGQYAVIPNERMRKSTRVTD